MAGLLIDLGGMLVPSNFDLANRNLPGIIGRFARRTRLASRSRIDVSGSAVRYHAVVLAAPRYFGAGNSLNEGETVESDLLKGPKGFQAGNVVRAA